MRTPPTCLTRHSHAIATSCLAAVALAATACSERWHAPLLTVTPVDMDGSAGNGAVGVVRPERVVPFGAELAPGTFAAALDYYTVPAATMRSCVTGVVRRIVPHRGDRDGEAFDVHVSPAARSPWVVVHAGMRAPRVRKGQHVDAGDPLGEVGRLGESLGRCQLQVIDERDGVAHCPLSFGSPQLLERHEALLAAARAQDARVTTLCVRATVPQPGTERPAASPTTRRR